MNNIRRYTKPLLPIAVLIALMLGLAFYAIGVVDRHSCQVLSDARFDRITQQMQENEQEQEIILKEIRSDYLTRARIISMLISNSPQMLKTENSLEELRIAVGCDILSVSDADGVITHTTAQTVAGATIDSAFRAGLSDRVFSDVIVQSGETTKILAGTARLDDAGVVQLTFEASDLNRVLASTELSTLTQNMNFMKRGTLAILGQNAQYLSHTDSTRIGTGSAIEMSRFRADAGKFSATVNGIDAYVFYRKIDDYVLVCTVPKSELYARRNTVTGWMTALGAVILALMALQIRSHVKPLSTDDTDE